MSRIAAIALMVAAALGIGALAFRLRSVPPEQAAPPFALVSASIKLPDDDATLPPGPQVDLVTSRCTACHSAEMILTQPALSAAQWQATVTKMREVYHAPVATSEDPAILAYLTGLSAAKLPSRPAAPLKAP